MKTLMRLLYRLRRSTPTTFRPVILVTGCGSGIGLALASLLHAQRQYRVIVTTRRSSIAVLRKRFIEDDRFLIRPLDVTSDQERRALVREIDARWGGVNILINNAGISYRSVLEQMSEDEELEQLDVNYLAPVALTRLVLPRMRAVGRGKIINVSSVSGMLAMPTMASYSASKHALEGASEALWHEVRPFGIDVSLIQPGFVRSKSFERVHLSGRSLDAISTRGVYSDYYTSMAPFIEKLMGLSLTTPEMIARKILRVIQTEDPPLFLPATPDAFVFTALRRLVPRRVLLPVLFALLPGAARWGVRESHSRKHGFAERKAAA